MDISIHSPHARGDPGRNFSISSFSKFQSTPLMRGETKVAALKICHKRFQSTPLMRGETFSQSPYARRLPHFNPLPSCEGRHSDLAADKLEFISIHSPHARGDFRAMAVMNAPMDFNPLPSCEGRRKAAALKICHKRFQSTPLMRGETRAKLQRFWNYINFNPLPSREGRRFVRAPKSSAR